MRLTNVNALHILALKLLRFYMQISAQQRVPLAARIPSPAGSD